MKIQTTLRELIDPLLFSFKRRISLKNMTQSILSELSCHPKVMQISVVLANLQTFSSHLRRNRKFMASKKKKRCNKTIMLSLLDDQMEQNRSLKTFKTIKTFKRTTLWSFLPKSRNIIFCSLTETKNLTMKFLMIKLRYASLASQCLRKIGLKTSHFRRYRYLKSLKMSPVTRLSCLPMTVSSTTWQSAFLCSNSNIQLIMRSMGKRRLTQ